ISNVSSFSSCCSERTIASNASQLRAALPAPPYTINSSGFSATSGSRLFIKQRSAASWCQPLQLSVAPRGARIVLADIGAHLTPVSEQFHVTGGTHASGVLDLARSSFQARRRRPYRSLCVLPESPRIAVKG